MSSSGEVGEVMVVDP